MTDRTRRRLLVASGAGLAGLAAGCLEETGDPAGESDDGNGDGNARDDENSERSDRDEDEDDSSETDTGDVDDEDTDGNDGDEPEEARVDTPPHEPERPAHDDPENWDDHYLGNGMESEPTLEFEPVSAVRLEERAVDGQGFDIGEFYSASLLETKSDLESAITLEETDDESRETLEDVSFDNQIVLVIESGFGSSSVRHEWVRVEAVDDGVHVHGYDVRPREQTMDYSPRHSVLVVDRPADVDDLRATVSHTTSEDQRVHYDSSEGVVTLESEADG
ncbi:hypothetical protein G6M89_18075 [Natronolimnobius sp. AArcel1]|uniref:hypothetical protein n=1 Tax=Natronolimnobius sp. AArcel1 TaxID=1679093 RepID=UPI0013EAB76C|nr:hypothetical protein [Natronolimnobius sp. AArcel1]NGM70885.1 hypothetical protein [Natronolimnobius sp. AArcel1]